MYRKRFGRIRPSRVIDFLLLDNEFPRAVRRCINLGEDSLYTITGGRRGSWTNAAEKRMGRLRADLEYASVEDVIAAGVHEWVDRFQTKLNDVGRAVHDTFFALDDERR